MTGPAEPSLTVVVPVWDGYVGAPLDAALASILAQEPSPLVIAVDNASGTPLPSREGVRVVRTDGRVSLGRARQHALKYVTTPFVVFWDADDLMVQGSIAHLLDCARKMPSVVAHVGAIIDGTSGRRHHWPRSWSRPLARFPRLFATVNAVSSLYPTIGSVLRTDAVRAAGGFPDMQTGDDYVLGVGLALQGPVNFTGAVCRVYGHGPESISSGWSRADLRRHAAAARERFFRAGGGGPWVRPLIAAAQWLVIAVVRPVAVGLFPRDDR